MEDKRRTNLPPEKGRRLLLFPVPLQGHMNPMIQLANLLRSKGFSITIIHTKFNSPDTSKYPQFTFCFIADGLSEAEASTSDIIVLIKKLIINCVEPFRECLINLLSEGNQEPVACLITDTIWYFTQELADRLKLPRIAFRTTSICSFLVFNALPVLREKGYLPKKDSELETQVKEFPKLKVKDIPEITTSSYPEDLYSLTGRMMKITKLASGLIFNSFKELEDHDLNELGKKFRMPTFTIGPVHKYFPACSSSLLKQDRSAISWLDSQAPKSVIYVSFGSVAEMNETDLAEVAWGIANSMQPFLWVIRPGLVQSSQKLEKLPKGFREAMNGRGYIVEWAPQQDVLAHPAVGGFWTHSGWNSTLESLSEGIPMICSPFFGDQLVNARYVNDVWRIGVQLEKGLERGEIERAIRKLMVDEEGEEIRVRATSFKKKIDFCLEQGGSSYESLESFVDYISSL